MVRPRVVNSDPRLFSSPVRVDNVTLFFIPFQYNNIASVCVYAMIHCSDDS